MSIIKTNLKYKKNLIPLDFLKVFFIMLHHTGCFSATFEEIHNWHLEKNYDGFGYNEYIRKDGTIYIGRGDNIGAHTYGMNSKSYGICLEGNYDIENVMPVAQFNSLIIRLNYNKNRLPNKIEIEPHSKFVNTTCPGKHFPMIEILESLNIGIEVYLKILSENKIINSPQYWIKQAKKGELVKGEYAVELIKNMAQYITK